VGLPGLTWIRKHRARNLAGGPVKVAIHPGASHPSRHWPAKKWRELIGELRRQNFHLTLLGSPAEREELQNAFSEEIGSSALSLVAEPIPQFVDAVTNADILIGMDSFSVHAAYALGVPAVVLNGSADPRILTPPGSAAVSAGDLCNQYPCYYAFPCRKQESEYVCVRGIETKSVLKTVEELVHRVHTREREAGVD